MGVGKGKNKKEAEQAASKQAMKKTENTEILGVLNEKRISWSCSNKVL